MAAFITSRDQQTPSSAIDPMDLIRYEVLRNLDNWLNRLLVQKEYNRLAWIEFGWSSYQLHNRYPQWQFLNSGLDVLEAAKAKDEVRVKQFAQSMKEILSTELGNIDLRKSIHSVA
ncbi:hypothetical protein KQI63_00635 [bacterium]|nr:hypothetical protein [bacterium]